MSYYGHITGFDVIQSNINSSSPNFKQSFQRGNYEVFFSGRLFNVEDEKTDLNEFMYAKIALESYLRYGKDFLKYIDGSFSLAIIDLYTKEIILARDRLGTKPLYYAATDSEFIFSNSIKDILANSSVKPCIGKDEICEIFGLGPAHSPGKTFFKDILEIKPGYFGVFNKSGFKEYCYWDLNIAENTDTLEKNILTSRSLVISALKRDVTPNSACMLSGGLDSSVLTMLTTKEVSNLKTYSIDFIENKDSFKGTDYQPTQDKDFVKIMVDKFNTNHTTFTFSTEELFNSLKEAMCAREMPGMADVDCSILVFLKKIKESGTDIIISGECSDEIFGGYPWYYKEHLVYSPSFPWAKSLDIRSRILKDNIVSKRELENYVEKAYNRTSNNVVYASEEIFENTFKKNCYNTIKWFMACLVERTERMADYVGIDVRTPFADYKIFEYIYNVSANRKLGLIDNNTTPVEKYLLRKAFEKDLPENIVYRKKSPFPKTYDPKYLELLENEIKNIINTSSSPILEIINVKYLYELLDTHGNNMKENWFGQLMTYPQTLAYLIQINMWLEEYNIEIDI